MKKVSWSQLFTDVYHGKRLIEFVVFCLEQERGIIRYHNIAEVLNVDEESVKRYRRQLNSIGITIHSYKKTGIAIDRDSLSENTIERFVKLYQAYITIMTTVLYKDYSFIGSKIGAIDQDRAISELCKLTNLVLMQRAIERNEEILIETRIGEHCGYQIVTPLHFEQDDVRLSIFVRKNYKTECCNFANIINVKRISKRSL